MKVWKKEKLELMILYNILIMIWLQVPLEEMIQEHEHLINVPERGGEVKNEQDTNRGTDHQVQIMIAVGGKEVEIRVNCHPINSQKD